jgi:hypothetical protein
VRKALKAIYENNFISNLGEFFNPCRVFGLNDEAGLIICSWPEGSAKPVIPVPYSQEVMTGFEYAAASHMLMAGYVEEGLDVVRAVRDRYDGEKRNPWNEFECGSNYARAMASYALLISFSGFHFDMVKGFIGFDPLVWDGGQFECFWALNNGWGSVQMTPSSFILNVLYGDLSLRGLRLPFLLAGEMTVILDDMLLEHQRTDDSILFMDTFPIKRGQKLQLRVQ